MTDQPEDRFKDSNEKLKDMDKEKEQLNDRQTEGLKNGERMDIPIV